MNPELHSQRPDLSRELDVLESSTILGQGSVWRLQNLLLKPVRIFRRAAAHHEDFTRCRGRMFTAPLPKKAVGGEAPASAPSDSNRSGSVRRPDL